jgi:hypothetical protein
VSLSIFVIVVALMLSPINERQPVVQGMIAIVSGVIGYYFGNRGAERAEERVREVESQLTTGVSPLAIQRGRIDQELREIYEKMKNAIDQAKRASQLHRDDQKSEADRYFRLPKESADAHCNCAMQAWLIANHAWLKHDQDSPPYKEILGDFKESLKLHGKSDVPSGLFSKFCDFGKAIALISINQDDEEAIKLLNGIENEITEMYDLYEAEDLKKEEVSNFLNHKDKLKKKVVKYLEEAKSHYEKKEKG